MSNYRENTDQFKIRTPDGFMDFAGISYMGEKEIFLTNLEGGFMIETTSDHPVFVSISQKKLVSELVPGDEVQTDHGTKKVLSSFSTGRFEKVYDVIDVDGGHRFFANGVLVSNCEFVSEDDTLINPLTLNRMNPTREQFIIGDSRWFKEPVANHVYGVGWDPAAGSLGDFSTIQVIDFTTMEQIAEWKSNQIPVHAQLEMLIKILFYIYQTLEDDPEQDGEPELFWTVENNGLGLAADAEINHVGEENIPGTFVSEPVKSKIGGYRVKGLRTTSTTKMAACVFLKKLVESDTLKICSRPLIRELKNFVRSGGSYAAKRGEHDDLVMSLIITLRLLIITQEWSDNISSEIDGDNPLDDLVIEPMPFFSD